MFNKGRFYWVQDRKTHEYHAAMCTDDKAGKFRLSESEPEVDTNKVKVIGSLAHELAYYVGEEEVQRWVNSRIEGPL